MKRILTLFCLFPLLLSAQGPYSSRLQAYMKAQHTVNGFSGTVLVMQQGKVLYSQSFGMADQEWNMPNRNEGRYRIGSLTKQFTAVCILQLEAAGKLKLTDHLDQYIPGYPQGDKVTLHMLLSQTSGIKDYTEISDSIHSDVVGYPPLTIIDLFKNAPYNFPPGTDWAYSNSNYFLLGYIVEKVSGLSFAAYLRTRLLPAAGLHNTGMDRADSLIPLRVKGYEDGRNAPYFALEGPYAAGGMIATAADLATWAGQLFSGHVLPAASLQKMTTPYGPGHYGYGVFVDSLGTQPRIWHNGGIPGFASYLGYFPGQALTVAVLSNNESNATAIGNALAGTVLGMQVAPPYVHKAIALDPQLLDRLAGTYFAGNRIVLVRKGNKLYRQGSPDDLELRPESATKFFYSDGSDRQLKFDLDKNGHVARAWIIVGGLMLEMKRL